MSMGLVSSIKFAIQRLWGPGQLLSRDDHELLVYFASVGYKHLTASALTSRRSLRRRSN